MNGNFHRSLFIFLPCLVPYKEKKEVAFVEAFMVRSKYIVDRSVILFFPLACTEKKEEAFGVAFGLYGRLLPSINSPRPLVALARQPSLLSLPPPP